jgi:transketolase
MRNEFAAAVMRQADNRDCFFLTGDLGFAALEPVRAAFGERFINAGVAEQNMIGVAAGIARTGARVYAYSIASFASLRAVEHLRLDVVGAGVDVCVVGNGGGYGYGHMGPTHHALNDVGVLSSIGMTCLVPAFADQVGHFVRGWSGPTYLRPGRDALGKDSPAVPAGPLELVIDGARAHVVALGPLAGVAVQGFGDLDPASRPAVWACTTLPLPQLPTRLTDGQPIVVFEEHERIGGLGQQLAYALQKAGHGAPFVHAPAQGYPTGRYGSQEFHRHESGLDAQSMRRVWQSAVS